MLDTGPGIAEQDQVKVFQEFERLQRHAHQGEEGLGLGLAIVSRYAELLGHRLRLQSVPGRGTLFSISVTYGQPQAVGRAKQVDGGGPDLAGLRIICLDNDPLVLDGMQQLLLTMGAQVSGVRNRTELLQHFSNSDRPDIVLADYHLDDGDTGLNAMLEVRQLSGTQVPCIINSADDSDVIRDRAKAVGFRFLPKPINAARLRALVLALTRH